MSKTTMTNLEKQPVTVPGLADPTTNGRFHENCVTVDGFVYLSGQIGCDEHGDLISAEFEPQVRQTFSNIERALDAAGSSLASLIHLTVWLPDMRFADVFSAIKDEVLDGTRVTSTVIGNRELANPEARIEIEARAITDDSPLDKRIVEVPALGDPQARGETHAHCLSVGEWVYASGQGGLDEHFEVVSPAFEPQMERTYENVGTVLMAGGSAPENMITMTTWLKDMRESDTYSRIRSESLGREVSTSTRLGASAYLQPDARVEMEFIGLATDSDWEKTSVEVPDHFLSTMERDGETYPRFWQAITVGDWVYTAGQAALDEDFEVVSLDVEDQSRKTLENVEKTLRAAGSSPDDIVHMRTYLTDMRYTEAFRGIRREMMGESFTSTLTHTPKLALPTLRVETEVIAIA